MRERIGNVWDWAKTLATTAGLWFLIHARGIVFTLGLLAVSIGAGMERASLGFLVPGGLVVSLIVLHQFLLIRGGHRD